MRGLGREPSQWHDDELRDAFPTDREALLAGGWIRQTDSSSFTECPYCGPGTMGRVHPIMNRRTGRTGLWLPCRECGLVEIPGESLRRWVLDHAAFVAAVARAAGIRGEPEPFADGRGWFLGRAVWVKRSHEVFLVRAVSEKTARILHERLRTHSKAVIFAARSEDAAAWQLFAGEGRVVVLDSVLSFTDELRCDVPAIEALLQPEAVNVARTRPVKRTGLLAKIALLKRELLAHIRAAKQFTEDAEERGVEVELLPRPTKSQLARMAGLQPHDVTRSFDDAAGYELRVLWEVADDLAQVMRYGG